MKSFKQIIQESIEKRAKQLAWNSLSKKEQKLYLKQSKEIEQTEMSELAIKCVKEVDEAMSDPNYVSRADPDVYK